MKIVVTTLRSFALTMAFAAAATAQNKVYFTTGSGTTTADALIRVNADGTGQTTLASDTASFGQPEGLAIDHALGYIFIADGFTGKKIVRFNLDGTGRTVLHSVTHTGLPHGLAIDPVDQKIYFTTGSATAADDRLVRINYDGTGETTLAADVANFVQPGQLSIDTVRGFLYVADAFTNATSQGFLRYNLDGTGRTVMKTWAELLPAGAGIINGSVVDRYTGEIYVCTGSGTTSNDRIWRMNGDGSGLTSVVSDSANFVQPVGIFLDKANGYLYVGDSVNNTVPPEVLRFNLDGTSRTVISSALTVQAVNFGLAIDSSAPTISNVLDQGVATNGSTGALGVTVADAETPAANLIMSGSSSNLTLVPNANIVFGGSGTSRTVTVTPAAGQSGTATITLIVDDGAVRATDTFVLTVSAGAPEINVIGNSLSIADGDPSPSLTDHTSFGSVVLGGGTVVRTFTVQNTGGTALNLTGTPRVVVSGTNAAEFVLTSAPSASISAGGSTSFQVTFTPGAIGLRTATLSIPNDDSDENPYDFAISGSGTCPAINLAALPNGIAGAAYSGAASASGGTGPYTYAVTLGALPTGLGLTPSGAGAGTLSPTSTTAGTFNFQITATAANSCTGSQSYIVHIGSAISAGDLVVREFRARGPVSVTDEYVEIANRTSGDITIAATDGSSGFGIGGQNAGASCPAGSPQLLATIPSGTVIPAGGSYLAVNTTGYSLNDYGGVGAASPNAPWTVDLCDGSGVALFRSSTTLSTGTVLDAVGFAATSSSPYIEGTGLLGPSGLISAPGQHAFTRKAPYPLGSIKDTSQNSADFQFISVDAALNSGVQSILGTPGPRNLAAPTGATLPTALAEPTVSQNLAPNRIQSGNYYYFRQKITNNTSSTITKFRMRIADLATLYSPGYNPGVQADWRAIGTTDVGLTLLDASTPTARGLILEAPTVAFSATGKGGGYNASFVVDLTDLGAGLADGDSIYVNIGFRNVKGGAFFLLLVPEILN